MKRRATWTASHWTAVLCCLASFVAAGLIAKWVFEYVPHVEDEIAYFFQAQVFATGRTHTDAPLDTNCFFAPFVIDHQGRRFGKYTPGWPALLAVGVGMGQPWWVNAACAALTVALVFRLAHQAHSSLAGAIAAVLAATSPFVLLLSGSLMSHTACLVFITAFLWCFRCTFSPACNTARTRASNPHFWALVAGIMLGCAFTIRPFTALAIAFPAGIYALWRLYRYREGKKLWFIGLGFVPLALIVPIFNAIWTGDPLLSPYTLFWPYDRIGFGPGHGPTPQGNTLWIGLGEAILSVGRLATHLYGWPALSLTLVIVAFLFKPRSRWYLFLACTGLSLILSYVLYWTHGNLFGPRYSYETTSVWCVLSAVGLVRLRQWIQTKHPTHMWALYASLTALFFINLSIYLPSQFKQYKGLFDITASAKKILLQANLDNALVIVQDGGDWKRYAVPFILNTPTLDGNVVYASDCGSMNRLLIEHFSRRSGRSVYIFDGETIHPFDPNDP